MVRRIAEVLQEELTAGAKMSSGWSHLGRIALNQVLQEIQAGQLFIAKMACIIGHDQPQEDLVVLLLLVLLRIDQVYLLLPLRSIELLVLEI